MQKEVYVKKFTNSGSISAGAYVYFDFQSLAEKSDYLPHNKLRLFNKSSVEVYVYLNGVENSSQPDYILSAGTGLDESIVEGVQYNSIAVKNNDGTISISADEIIGRFATVRNV